MAPPARRQQFMHVYIMAESPSHTDNYMGPELCLQLNNEEEIRDNENYCCHVCPVMFSNFGCKETLSAEHSLKLGIASLNHAVTITDVLAVLYFKIIYWKISKSFDE